jgi:hypothetical protein
MQHGADVRAEELQHTIAMRALAERHQREVEASGVLWGEGRETAGLGRQGALPSLERREWLRGV